MGQCDSSTLSWGKPLQTCWDQQTWADFTPWALLTLNDAKST